MTPEALAREVHRLRFPDHADCEPNPVEVRNARLHLEALAMSNPPGVAVHADHPDYRDEWKP